MDPDVKCELEEVFTLFLQCSDACCSCVCRTLFDKVNPKGGPPPELSLKASSMGSQHGERKTAKHQKQLRCDEYKEGYLPTSVRWQH